MSGQRRTGCFVREGGGGCLVGGGGGGEADPAEMATAAVGTHPT